MIRHKVEQGESITSIAFRYGFFPDTLWQHADNANLRKLRTDGDILLPGDVVTVPPLRIRQQDGETGKRHRFKRKGVPARTRMQIFDENGPRASQNYVLSIDGREVTGSTDADGVLEAFIPPDAIRGNLTIGPDQRVFTILFGHLDPITEISGVQKRLNNLGFDCGEPDGQMNDATVEALRRFQYRAGLEMTGKIDDATMGELRKIHDLRGALPDAPPAPKS